MPLLLAARLRLACLYAITRCAVRTYNLLMAVYLITFHSYGSWLPDRARGYTRRGLGVLPKDTTMAGYYRESMKDAETCFNTSAQRLIVESVHDYVRIKECLLYAIATDATHVHILLGWRGYRLWVDGRRGLKSTITRKLNHAITQRSWLSRGGSRKRVADKKHFTCLTTQYLPGHRGLCWSADLQGAVKYG